MTSVPMRFGYHITNADLPRHVSGHGVRFGAAHTTLSRVAFGAVEDASATIVEVIGCAVSNFDVFISNELSEAGRKLLAQPAYYGNAIDLRRAMQQAKVEFRSNLAMLQSGLNVNVPPELFALAKEVIESRSECGALGVQKWADALAADVANLGD